MSQEKSKGMPMQIFLWGVGGGGGVKELYYGICTSSEYIIVQAWLRGFMLKFRSSVLFLLSHKFQGRFLNNTIFKFKYKAS